MHKQQQTTYYGRGLLFLLLLAVPTLVLLDVNQGLADVARSRAPEGQFLYVLSKLFGLCAFVLLCAQMFLTLLDKYKTRARLIVAGRGFHIALGLVLSGVIVLHAGLFISAASLRSGHFAWHWLLPDFSNGYYVLAVSLGVLALYLILCSIYFGHKARKRAHDSAKFRRGHVLVYAVSALVLVHAGMIGNEIQTGWWQWFYWLAVIGLTAIVLLKLAAQLKRILYSRRISEASPQGEGDLLTNLVKDGAEKRT